MIGILSPAVCTELFISTVPQVTNEASSACGTIFYTADLGQIPLKITFFMWVAFQDKILTVDCLVARGRNLPNRSSTWCQASETVNHLLVHCSFATNIWSFLSIYLPWHGLCTNGLQKLSVHGLRGGEAFLTGEGKSSEDHVLYVGSNKILNMDHLMARGHNLSNSCSMCCQTSETVNHVISLSFYD